ncbi:methyltransferase domain-containing protein [Roseovarius sp. M141]|uniref:class I SAM-dependent methyltransferase n=1 Tax=Roseovarius sp. M141 TaxID=2583806 RepID=UPI0020CBEDCB|nr:class I SAM-dependent methyltransferase [Roseovarius sp. M141]
MKNDILKGYQNAAGGDFIERIEGISSAELLSPVIGHFPQQSSHVADIGAGTGRDAAWLASLSHTVVAVEPVDALRDAGIAKHKSPSISWINDTLPQLSQTIAIGRTFDVILLCAVWQHLNDADRQVAFSAFRRLISDGGKIIMSIRHGAGAPTRPVYPANVSDTVKWAELQGFSKLSEVFTQSVQAQNYRAGISWTWLVLQA